MILSLILQACTISFGGEELSDAEKMETAVAQTVAALQQQTQTEPEEQVIPTITQAPTNTQPSPPTQTPQPCNRAQFVSETIPDGTVLLVEQDFVKTWRLKNTGTCTWNTNYQVFFAEGDKMGGPSSKSIGQLVKPGEMVDITLDLKVPADTGIYKGYWKVRDDQGITFVHNLWVEIEVKKFIILIPMITLMPIIPGP